MIRLVLPIAGLFCAIAGPAAAQPFTVHEAYSPDPSKAAAYAVVPYADLDLTNSAGARMLLARIEAAAEAVCGGARSPSADASDCRAAAISGAVARMRNRPLTDLAAGRRGERRAER